MAAFPSVFLQSSLSSPINFDQPFIIPQHNNNNNNEKEPSSSSVFSVTNKNSMEMDSSSVITHHNYFHLPHNHLILPLDNNNNKRKTSSPNSAQSKDLREVKGKKQRKLVDCEEKKEAPPPSPTGYIHVRARRGQATDRHSLAERVRRERISERMKLLQALVPGCDKVTGKALMLDEIINYVQSLQNQVEFLSMKLASVNPMVYDFGMDLESLMVRPDQSLATPCPTYPLLDNSSNSFHLQQIPYALPQGEKQVLWGVDHERQKILNQSEFSSLFSFPLMQ